MWNSRLRSAPLGPPQQPQPRDPGRGAEEVGPVVRVEHRGEREGEADRGAAPDSASASVVKACSQQVSATIASSATSAYIRPSCAYCVRNGLTATSSAAIQAVRAAEQRPARPERDRHHDRREQHGEPVDARLRAPEDLQPEAEQHVVERRRAVLAQHARDVAERPVGDPDREALVDPEPDVELPRAQQHGARDEQAEAERDGDASAADRPCPQPPRRPGGVGGHPHEVRGSARCSCERRPSAGSW